MTIGYLVSDMIYLGELLLLSKYAGGARPHEHGPPGKYSLVQREGVEGRRRTAACLDLCMKSERNTRAYKPS